MEKKLAKDVEGYNNLTKVEQRIFRMMYSQGAVPMIKGRAGEGKSAIIESIATKLGMNFIDLRLSLMDELSVGLYPTLSDTDMGYKLFDYAIPSWSNEANKRPTIVNFEELNRCRKSVQDAVLGILNERRIGSAFKFNDGVFMVATGNLGDADGTVVTEFDAALKNRMNVYNHKLTIQDWKDGYATKNVLPVIVKYIDNNASEFYKLPDNVEEVDNFASPRSWSNLSKHIVSCLGDNPNINEMVELLEEDGLGIIGNSAIKFIDHLKTIKRVTFKDILNNYSKLEDEINALERPERTSIFEDLKEFGVNNMKPKQLKNFMEFFRSLALDEQGAYLQSLVKDHIIEASELTEDAISKSKVPAVVVLREFKPVLESIFKSRK